MITISSCSSIGPQTDKEIYMIRAILFSTGIVTFRQQRLFHKPSFFFISSENIYYLKGASKYKWPKTGPNKKIGGLQLSTLLLLCYVYTLNDNLYVNYKHEIMSKWLGLKAYQETDLIILPQHHYHHQIMAVL